MNVAAYRATKGVYDMGDVAQKHIVKSGGCSSCPVRCYSEYDIDILAEYDLPTKVSNTCAPTSNVAQNFFAEGRHDFREKGDAKLVTGLHGAHVLDDMGLWCNYGNLGREFYWCYHHGIFEKFLPKEEYDSIPWQLMKDGDPRWIDDIYGRIARKEGEISRLGEGTYQYLHAWGLDDPTKNEWGINFYDLADSSNHNMTYICYPKHHSSEECWQSGLLYNVMYNRDCMDHVMTNFVRSGSPYELVIKPVAESFFGEGCTDAPKKYTPINANKVKLAKWAFLQKQWHDSATLCNWMYPMTLSPRKDRGYKGDIELDAKYMTAVTGEEWSMDDILFAMERISNMLRVMTAISFKLNENSTNLRQDHDKVTAWAFDQDPEFKAFEEGTVKMDRDDWEKSLDMFYEAMGWNKETGIPTRQTLEKFGLDDMADKLEELSLI